MNDAVINRPCTLGSSPDENKSKRRGLGSDLRRGCDLVETGAAFSERLVQHGL